MAQYAQHWNVTKLLHQCPESGKNGVAKTPRQELACHPYERDLSWINGK